MTRDEWLTALKPGDPVRLLAPFGERFGVVETVGSVWIVVKWNALGGGTICTRCWKSTGALQSGVIRIEPPDVLPAIGGEPEAPDTRVGGWEAA